MTGSTTLQIDGLKSSKAASNSDGGLESLLGFLERKAAGLDAGSNRAVRIKKVCFLV
jgi:nuclear RNA export factor